MLSASKTLWTLYICKVMWDIFSNHYIRPGIIIVNLTRAGELFTDLYGTDNPHLRLLATIMTVNVISDKCLTTTTITTSGETCVAGITSHTSSIIRLTITQMGKTEYLSNIYTYIYTLKSKHYKHKYFGYRIWVYLGFKTWFWE